MPDILSRVLYMELLAVALILLIVLLVNNIALYKLKFNDQVSVMIILSIAVCAFEMLWEYCDTHPWNIVLSYIAVIGYTISFYLVTVTFNHFVLGSIGLLPDSKKIQIIFYAIPFVVILFLVLTTPWTHWVYYIGENGTLQATLLEEIFYDFLYLYFFTAIIPSIYIAIFRRKSNPEVASIARSMTIFAMLMMAMYMLQLVLIGGITRELVTFATSWAVGMAYLITTINTRRMLKNRSSLEAAESDMRIAWKIQNEALPDALPRMIDNTPVKLRTLMVPARQVGGDFYDYFPLDDKRLCFLIADVSGKGMPSALFMMKAMTTIKDHAMVQSDTAEVFKAVNSQLCLNNHSHMFATAWIGILNIETLELTFTNAGHCYPLFKREGQEPVFIKDSHGIFLGGLETTTYSTTSLQLKGGDCLLLYTDGVTDARNANKEQFGDERLKELFDEIYVEDEKKILDDIFYKVKVFAAGVPQFDDITMLVIKIKK